MRFVPWKYVADWKCTGCGDCCRLYSVVLNFHEWLSIVKNYGAEHTASSLNELLIRRKEDGSCTFLCRLPNTHACGLQHMKPKACQLWPFKIHANPRFGFANEAKWHYGGKDLFVYADSMCSGLRYGSPSWEFNYTLQEFVEIAAGLRNQQYRTTRSLGTLSNQASRSVPTERILKVRWQV